LPQQAQSIRVHFPDDFDRTPALLTPVDPSYTAYDPIEWTGLYRVTWDTPGAEDEEQSRVFAVNMFNALEGDVRPAPEVVFPGADDILRAERSQIERRQIWPWALLASVLVLLIEWWVYVRRAYI
jgi:hypothetical protein